MHESKLIYTKSTKNAHVYANGVFPGLYVPKAILGPEPPAELTLILKFQTIGGEAAVKE